MKCEISKVSCVKHCFQNTRGFTIFPASFTSPEHKFLQDKCLGLLKGETIINNKIALNLLEDHSPKDICKRFTRHLNKEDLGRRLLASIITSEYRGFDMETGIIVDESDIIKPKAKKMEGCEYLISVDSFML